MLPNANDLPSESAQLATHVPVPLAISGDFGIPVFSVAAGPPIEPWATVPKAAIYKKNHPFAPKCEVGFTKKCLVTSPAGDSEFPKNLDQVQLS